MKKKLKVDLVWLLKEVAFIAGTSENPADQKTFYYFFH